MPCGHRLLCERCNNPRPATCSTCHAQIASTEVRDYYQADPEHFASAANVRTFDDKGLPKKEANWQPPDNVRNVDLRVVVSKIGDRKTNPDIAKWNLTGELLDDPSALATTLRAAAGSGLGYYFDVMSIGIPGAMPPNCVIDALKTVTAMDWVTTGAAHLVFVVIDVIRWWRGDIDLSVLARNVGEQVLGFGGNMTGAMLAVYVGGACATMTATSGVAAAFLGAWLCELAVRWLYRKGIRWWDARKAKQQAEAVRLEAMDLFHIFPTDTYAQAKHKYYETIKVVHPDHNAADDANAQAAKMIAYWNLVRMGFDTQQIDPKQETQVYINTLHVYCRSLKQWVLRKVWFTPDGECIRDPPPLPNSGMQDNQVETRTRQLFI